MPKDDYEPHVTRESFSYGWLRNGNRPGNPNKAPRCHASSKRTGLPCRQPAMPNGCCRLHGGKSTGPKTPEGLSRSQKSNWNHGFYGIESKKIDKILKSELEAARSTLKHIGEKIIAKSMH